MSSPPSPQDLVQGILCALLQPLNAVGIPTPCSSNNGLNFDILTMAPSTSEPLAGEAVDFSGQDTSIDGIPVTYQPIYLFVNGKNVGQGSTDGLGNYGQNNSLVYTFLTQGIYSVYVSEQPDGSGSISIPATITVGGTSGLLSLSATKTISNAVSSICQTETGGACTVFVTIEVTAVASGGVAPYTFLYQYADGTNDGPTQTATDTYGNCCLGSAVIVTVTDAIGSRAVQTI